MAILKEYLVKKYPTPQDLKNKYPGAKALIIGTGTSTAQLVPHKSILKNKFDVIIGLNFATKHFEDIIDYRLIVEKKSDGFVSDLKSRIYREDLPHIINWKSIDKYPQNLPLYKTTRCNFDFNPDIREYHYNGEEGLLIGPQDSTGLSAGSVACQALHLACILGASEVHMIGCDLVFKPGGDHYYGGNYYSNSKTKIANRSPIIDIVKDGVAHRSTEFFVNSARFIDDVIVRYCGPRNIIVFDLSGGLITAAKKYNVGDL